MSGLLFTNGSVVSMERETLEYQACAVRNGLICGVGDTELMREILGPGHQEYDLQGGALLPGFVDCHFHLIMACYFKMNLDLMGMGVRSVDELLGLLRERASSLQAGKWILGLRLNESTFREKRFPTLAELDAALPDHPVLIMRYDSHSGIANSQALKLAGIDRNTTDPPGGEICRADGALTGVLKEKAMVNLFSVIPVPEADELLRGRDLVRDSLLRQGVTGYHNILLTSEDGPSGALGPYEIPLFKLFEEGLPFRHYPLVAADTVGSTIDILAREFGARQVDGIWQGGGMKLFADGTFGSRTAVLMDDYADAPGERGFMVNDMEWLRKTVFEAQAAGLRVAVHTIGDGAMHQVARLLMDAQLEAGFRQLRHRIEHCGMVQPRTIALLKNAGVICSMQPSFIVSEGTWIRDRVGERVNRVYPMRSLLDEAIPMCGGSDAPVESVNPLEGIWACVVREGFTPDQSLTPFEAVSLYTSHAAFASGVECSRGTITPGKAADLVVLDRHPMTSAYDDIRSIRVQATVIDGRVYETS